MCGIAGYFTYDGGTRPSDSELDIVVDALSHRGPDDRGVLLGGRVGLGHRRLSIIDTSSASRQPFVGRNGTVWLVYNGELYNFKELKVELEVLGYAFKTTSDTEVVLNAYIEWGQSCVERFNGMFAIGVWDFDRNELWLARDHVGIKPLYYADYNGTIYFASEINAIKLFSAIPQKPDYYGLDCYFTFGYIPAPMTGYSHIRQLLPGQALSVKNGSKVFKQFWKLSLDACKHKNSEIELVGEFDAILKDAVFRQMVSDVPLGGFLSGGLDSFAIMRAASLCRTDPPVAYTIGFSNASYDESTLTRMSAKVLDLDLKVGNITSDPESLFNEVAKYCNDPFADSSSLPVYKLCQYASSNVKVALSGDGADELLAGYATHKVHKQAELFRRLPALMQWLIMGTAGITPDIGKYSSREKISRFIYGARKGAFLDHASWRTIVPNSLKHKLYSEEFVREVGDFEPLELYAKPIREALESGMDYLDALLYADFTFYLPNDMLVKVDRMSMAHSLEVRVPFLDLKVVDFCWRLPTSMKLRGGISKYILRKTIDDLYPSELKTKKKSGFNASPKECRLPYHLPRHLPFKFGKFGRFMADYSLSIFKQSYPDADKLLKC